MCRTAGSLKSESGLKVKQPVNYISCGSAHVAPSCGQSVLDLLSLLTVFRYEVPNMYPYTWKYLEHGNDYLSALFLSFIFFSWYGGIWGALLLLKGLPNNRSRSLRTFRRIWSWVGRQRRKRHPWKRLRSFPKSNQRQSLGRRPTKRQSNFASTWCATFKASWSSMFAESCLCTIMMPFDMKKYS